MIPQLCWILFCEGYGDAIGKALGMEEQVYKDAGRFMHWASEGYKDEAFKGKTFVMLNGYQVVLWTLETLAGLKF